jgi:hypothetical protein
MLPANRNVHLEIDCSVFRQIFQTIESSLSTDRFNTFLIQRISGYLDFIRRPVFEGTRRFGNWICFRPEVKKGEDT